MYATHWFENKILSVFNNVDATGIEECFVALFFTSPTNTGLAGVEVNYPGYTRLPITWTNPSPESGGIGIRNIEDLLWPFPPNDVGQVNHVGIVDREIGGNVILYADLASPLNILASSDKQPSIPQRDLLYYIIGDYTVSFMTKIMNVIRDQTLQGFNPHLALFDGDPDKDGLELSGNNYSRPEMTFRTPEIQQDGRTQTANSNIIRFPVSAGPWGRWEYTGVCDAITDGNVITKVPYIAPQDIQINFALQVSANGYRISLD